MVTICIITKPRTTQRCISTDNETRQKVLQEQANDLLESQTLKVLGSDTIDGNAVTIVEYSYNISGSDHVPKVLDME